MCVCVEYVHSVIHMCVDLGVIEIYFVVGWVQWVCDVLLPYGVCIYVSFNVGWGWFSIGDTGGNFSVVCVVVSLLVWWPNIGLVGGWCVLTMHTDHIHIQEKLVWERLIHEKLVLHGETTHNTGESICTILKGVIDKTGKFRAFNYKTGKTFVLKKFLPPDWALSDNVFDWFL